MTAPQEHRARRRLPPPARNIEIGNLLDAFLVCAVGTIVAIRFELWATNYPSLSPGTLHIAHMLWGGLGMMLAVGILLSFASRAWRLPAAILGGVGFGFFIDELGKFITADNDYFFQPTAALIYVIFIALFLASRALLRRRGFSQEEELAGAIDLVKEASWNGLDARDRHRAIELLGGADERNPIVGPLRELIAQVDARPSTEPGRAARLTDAARRQYFDLIRARRFRGALTALFVVLAFASLANVVLLLFAAEIAARGGDSGDILDHFASEAGTLSVGEWLHLAAATVAGAFMIAGAYRLRRSRLAAYRLFDRALLIQILIVQFFALLESEFGALIGLFFYLALFVTLRYVIAQEEGATASSDAERVGRGASTRASEPLPAATVTR